jgi:HlyD family secretion protein
MKKRIPIVLAVVAAAALAAWALLRRPAFLYAGTVEATYVDISPQLSSTISTVTVHEGDPVRVGQTLIELTGEDFRLAAQIAERDFDRGKRLHESGSMPDEAFDRLRFKRDDAALKVRWCTIASPIDGVVMSRYHEPGELVNPSMKLLTLADLSELWAYVYVPQPMLARISLNMPVTGVIPEMNSEAVPGRISHIRSEAEFTPKNVQTREERTRLVYGVKIAFPNRDGRLKPGMTVEVRLPAVK